MMTGKEEEDDYALALRLQQEEELRARGGRSAADTGVGGLSPSPAVHVDGFRSPTYASVFVEESPMRSSTGGSLGLGTVAEGPHAGPSSSSDSRLAAWLQMLEFEIAEEVEENPHEDFENKELASSSWRRQLKTVSTAICVVQVAFIIAMISQDGFAPASENPMVGPPATTLVRYGAKFAALIVYKKQWWRLVSPMALHAGVIHLICNVFIQLRVGGYLNLVYGTWKWLTIYILSGIFGELLSCCVMVDTVGVGSSGAIMGILASWIVWIVFRWKKIPPECHRQRNCQLSMVVASVVITLMFSFTPFVDWGAHLGGAIMGFVLAPALLSSELDDKRHAVRFSCRHALPFDVP